jgi:hypothetical protein
VKEKKLTLSELDSAQKRFVKILKPDSNEDQDKVREFHFLATFVFGRILPLSNTQGVHLPPRGPLRRSFARFLMLFTGRDAMSTALPMTIHPRINELILSLEDPQADPPCVSEIENACPELLDLISAIKQTIDVPVCATVLLQNLSSFLRNVMQRICDLDEGYDSCDSASEEELKPYDPSTGGAFYFTRSGGQVRNLPRYGSE